MPGAFGHAPEAIERMRTIVGLLDEVSIHLYPEGTPDTYAGMPDFQSLMAWINLADIANVPFTIGEFAIDGIPGPEQGRGSRTAEQLATWIAFFDTLAINRVDLWQFDVDLPWDGDHLSQNEDAEVQAIRDALPYLD